MPLPPAQGVGNRGLGSPRPRGPAGASRSSSTSTGRAGAGPGDGPSRGGALPGPAPALAPAPPPRRAPRPPCCCGRERRRRWSVATLTRPVPSRPGQEAAPDPRHAPLHGKDTAAVVGSSGREPRPRHAPGPRPPRPGDRPPRAAAGGAGAGSCCCCWLPPVLVLEGGCCCLRGASACGFGPPPPASSLSPWAASASRDSPLPGRGAGGGSRLSPWLPTAVPPPYVQKQGDGQDPLLQAVHALVGREPGGPCFVPLCLGLAWSLSLFST